MTDKQKCAKARLTFAFLLGVSCAAPAPAQSSPPLAAELVNVVVANELADRVERRKWMYLIEKQDGKQTLMEEQVETKDGPLYRLIAIDGTPLDPAHRQQENARIDRLLRDPGQQFKVKRAHDDDEQKLETLMRLMPQAFLYDYDGVEGTLVRVKFRPNPNYNPPTYEARVIHSLAGTILIDSQQHRLTKLSGQLISPVEFGYGFLGHIDNGGKVEIGRLEVGPAQWKTALIDIQLSGRLVLFKTISKQEHEIRSDFRAVPDDLSLSQGNELIGSRIEPISAPETRHTEPEATRRQFLPQ
ncbi:MAG TPA: hypothetical protein VN948_04305 [Terriglobales bacterium]|nr:hypothetical protein [Terriglobales bacterium]